MARPEFVPVEKSLLDLPSLPEAGLFQVFQTPACRLAGMALPPRGADLTPLLTLGFTKVINLCQRPDTVWYRCSFLDSAQDMDDLTDGGLPDDPEREAATYRLLAERAISLMRDREGVVVHCARGCGRTGCLLGCVAVLLGHKPAEVKAWLDAVNRLRHGGGWPESPWQARLLETMVGKPPLPDG